MFIALLAVATAFSRASRLIRLADDISAVI